MSRGSGKEASERPALYPGRRTKYRTTSGYRNLRAHREEGRSDAETKGYRIPRVPT
jgi:hypothetical protein